MMTQALSARRQGRQEIVMGESAAASLVALLPATS
jgi:hypothetical protein